MTNPFGHNPFESSPFQPGPVPGPGRPGPPPGSTPPSQPHGVNTLATLSVVFAFVFAPAGALLGHLGLDQIRRTGQQGRDRALIGVTLSYVVIIVALVAVIVWAAIDEGYTHSASFATTSTTLTVRTTL